MPIDIGERLRQTGADIAGAISGPAEMRYKISQMQREREQSSKKDALDNYKFKMDVEDHDAKMKERTDKETKDAARMRAAEAIRAKKGDIAADAFLSGQATYHDIFKMDKPEKPTAQERNEKNFTFFQDIDKKMTDFKAKTLEKVAEFTANGDKEGAAKAMQTFNEIAENTDKGLMAKIASMNVTMDESSGAQIITGLKKSLETIDENKYMELQDSVDSTLSKTLKTSQGSLDSLRKLEKKYGVEVTGSVLSENELKSLIVQKEFDGKITEAERQIIMGQTKDTNTLYKHKEALKYIYEQRNKNPELAGVALRMLEHITASDVLGVKMQEKLQPLESKFSEQDLNDLEESPLRDYAKKVKKSRGVKSKPEKKSSILDYFD